ncbi:MULTISPECIES: hypothetical protein [Shewanella]|uniref:Integrase n=1 Tax=Shewanella marisflavi TaxID=260364 RepID=A0ABX5WQG2_9GAMM|nr:MULTISPECIES: hypothetical protein [Shewanella]QDF76010.1 hypothetical protein FGA12_13095 [Shewanella marisflavi]
MRISKTTAYQKWMRHDSSTNGKAKSKAQVGLYRQLANAADHTQDKVTLSPLALQLSAQAQQKT